MARAQPSPVAEASRPPDLRNAFPDERIDLTDLPAEVDLTKLTADPDDQHICALAITGNAYLLLTFDRGYLQGPLEEHGIQILHCGLRPPRAAAPHTRKRN